MAYRIKQLPPKQQRGRQKARHAMEAYLDGRCWRLRVGVDGASKQSIESMLRYLAARNGHRVTILWREKDAYVQARLDQPSRAYYSYRRGE